MLKRTDANSLSIDVPVHYGRLRPYRDSRGGRFLHMYSRHWSANAVRTVDHPPRDTTASGKRTTRLLVKCFSTKELMAHNIIGEEAFRHYLETWMKTNGVVHALMDELVALAEHLSPEQLWNESFEANAHKSPIIPKLVALGSSRPERYATAQEAPFKRIYPLLGRQTLPQKEEAATGTQRHTLYFEIEQHIFSNPYAQCLLFARPSEA